VAARKRISTWPDARLRLGLAVSLLPILRVLPPLHRDAHTNGRSPGFAVSIVGVAAYVLLVTGAVILVAT
jgi:hypothetical protein